MLVLFTEYYSGRLVGIDPVSVTRAEPMDATEDTGRVGTQLFNGGGPVVTVAGNLLDTYAKLKAGDSLIAPTAVGFIATGGTVITGRCSCGDAGVKLMTSAKIGTGHYRVTLPNESNDISDETTIVCVPVVDRATAGYATYGAQDVHSLDIFTYDDTGDAPVAADLKVSFVLYTRIDRGLIS